MRRPYPPYEILGETATQRFGEPHLPLAPLEQRVFDVIALGEATHGYTVVHLSYLRAAFPDSRTSVLIGALNRLCRKGFIWLNRHNTDADFGLYHGWRTGRGADVLEFVSPRVAVAIRLGASVPRSHAG